MVGPILGSVGPWVPALLYVGPKSGSVGRGDAGSQPFSTWDTTPRLGFTMLIRVRGGLMITIFTAL